MSLVFDERGQLAGKPGCHCLLVGVSRYRHLPEGDGEPAERSFQLRQLSSTALSAYRLYHWLVEHKDQLALPLATVRLLLAPSETELGLAADLQHLGETPTRKEVAAAVRHWRRDARAHSDGMTFFYFAGHGVQRHKGDAVMLLHDFGDPDDGILAKTAEFRDIYYGMAPPKAIAANTMARRQLYFVDACRMLPSEFRSFEKVAISGIFGDVELGGVDDRRAPVFFSSLPGAKAYALRGEQTLFSRALLNCLYGSAAEAWTENGTTRRAVTVHSLNTTLEKEIEALREEHGGTQDYHPDVGKNAVLCFLPEEPETDQQPRVEVLVDIQPATAAAHARLLIHDADDAVVLDQRSPIDPRPLSMQLPEGFYLIVAEPQKPGFTRFEAWVRVRRPGVVHVKVAL